ncbi:MAG: formate--tetrahydrofolate ligase [Desulfobulbaceae bacterium]|nr:formate--tetrahydrofolate ligase [Desulfobulbaceae bacterium]
MALDPTKHADWEIAEEAESRMKTVYELGDSLGLKKEEVLPYGHYIGKLDFRKIMNRLGDKPDGKYVDVTAISPTPLGEGKSTCAMGLVQGLGKRGKSVVGAIRQPSGGPTMNIKGSAAGGGLAQCIPLTPFSLGLTGDINAIMNAHNLGMVALTSRMQHENNYTDEQLAQRNLKRLDIHPKKVEFGWIIDFCAQALRNITIGQGGKMDGYTMQSKFAIAVSSEIMAILSIANDLKDMRERIGKIVVAYDKQDRPITTADLEVDGAMTAWMVEALNPNLMQTLEGQPVLVHAGPFANIAIGQSSVIADRVGLKIADYNVTESGFGADIGFEKFWNLKCRYSGLKPNCAVVVATIRALKCHGGAPIPVPGRPMPEEYAKENVGWVEEGCKNLIHHIKTVKKAREVYGADGVSYSPEAKTKLDRMEKDPEMKEMGTCMVKTHLSLSHDPSKKGVPTGWTLPIRDILTYKGAGFVVPVAGAISLMPGTASDPAYRRIDVDTETGKVKGVF